MISGLRLSNRLENATPMSSEIATPLISKRQKVIHSEPTTQTGQTRTPASSRALGVTRILHGILGVCPTPTVGKAIRVNRFWHSVGMQFRYGKCNGSVFKLPGKEDTKFAAATVQTLVWDGTRSDFKWFAFPKLKRLDMTLRPMFSRYDFGGNLIDLANASPVLDSVTVNLKYDYERKMCNAFVDALPVFFEERPRKLRELRVRGKYYPRHGLNLDFLLSFSEGWDSLTALEGAFHREQLRKILGFARSLIELSLDMLDEVLPCLDCIKDSSLFHLSIKKRSWYLGGWDSLKDLQSKTLRVLQFTMRCNTFNDDHVKSMIQDLPNLHKLHLVIGGSSLSIASLNYIGQHCAHIEEVVLTEGLYALASLSVKLPRLKILEYCQRSIDIKAGEDLRETAAKVRYLMPRLVEFARCQLHHNECYTPLKNYILRTLIVAPDTERMPVVIGVPGDSNTVGSPTHSLPTSTLISICKKHV